MRKSISGFRKKRIIRILELADISVWIKKRADGAPGKYLLINSDTTLTQCVCRRCNIIHVEPDNGRIFGLFLASISCHTAGLNHQVAIAKAQAHQLVLFIPDRQTQRIAVERNAGCEAFRAKNNAMGANVESQLKANLEDFSLPLVGRAGVGVVLTLNAKSEFFAIQTLRATPTLTLPTRGRERELVWI
jgi:hypothetical protein